MHRSVYIKNLVKRRANGFCELCGKKITLLDKHGNPFIIPHHIIPLYKGGDDSVYNVAGICSRCHNLIHYGMNGEEANNKLKKIISEKQFKINEEKNHRVEFQKRGTYAKKINNELEEKRNQIKKLKDERLKDLEIEMKKRRFFRSRFYQF